MLAVPLGLPTKKAGRGRSLKARWRDHGRHERIPSTGRRPIVTKTAAEPRGVEAFVKRTRDGALGRQRLHFAYPSCPLHNTARPPSLSPLPSPAPPHIPLG